MLTDRNDQALREAFDHVRSRLQKLETLELSLVTPELATIQAEVDSIQLDITAIQATLAASSTNITIVYRGSAQTIADSAYAVMSWPTVIAELGDNMYDVGQPTRLTAQRAGWYRISAMVILPCAAQLIYQKNGTLLTTAYLDSSLDANHRMYHGWTEQLLAIGDYVEIVLRQTTGAPVNTSWDGFAYQTNPRFSMEYLRPA